MPLKNLGMFRKLCGEQALQNIILATTMWGEVEEEVGLQREKELEKTYWKGMIMQRSKVSRFLNTHKSAWTILDNFLQPAHEQQSVQLQKDMVDLQWQLSETKAGKKLYGQLVAIVKKQQLTLQKIRDESKWHGQNYVPQALKNQHESLRKELRNTVAQIQTLQIPVGMQLQSILSFHL
jgi:hypothetical protein